MNFIKQFCLRNTKILLIVLLYLFSVPALFWSMGTLYYIILPDFSFHGFLSILIPVLLFLLLFFRKKCRYFLPVSILCWCVIWIFYMSDSPRNNREWEASCRHQAYAEVSGDQVIIHFFRDFHYRTTKDFDERWITRRFKLSELTGVDLGVCHWDGMLFIAHTMLSFRFSDGRNLVFSVETRRAKDAPDGILPGLFKQFELIYILGSEEDLFQLRTNYRHEQLLLYPTATSKEDAEKLLLDVVARTNKIHKEPEFYNTISQNCTSTLLPSLKKIYPGMQLDIRVLLNGLSDQMAYQYGWLEIPKEHLLPNGRINRRFYLVNQYVEHLKEPKPYSRLIRGYQE